MNDDYLKKRGETWSVCVSVPKHEQTAVGKAEVVRALKTRDKAEANKRKHGVIAEILEDIQQSVREYDEQTKHSGYNDPAQPRWLDRMLAAELEAYSSNRTTLDEFQLHQQLLIDQHLKAKGITGASTYRHPDDPTPNDHPQAEALTQGSRQRLTQRRTRGHPACSY